MEKSSGILLSVLMASSMGFAGKNVMIAEDTVAPVVGNFYIGAGVSLVNFEYSDLVYPPEGGMDVPGTFEYEWKAGMVLAGYKFNDYISVEGRYTKSVGDATYTGAAVMGGAFDSDQTSAEFDNIALYLKPTLQFDQFALYGLLGYGKTTVTWGNGTENSDSSFQYGAGLSFAFTENLSVFADYVVMYDDDDFDGLVAAHPNNHLKEFKADAVTVGLVYTF